MEEVVHGPNSPLVSQPVSPLVHRHVISPEIDTTLSGAWSLLSPGPLSPILQLDGVSDESFQWSFPQSLAESGQESLSLQSTTPLNSSAAPFLPGSSEHNAVHAQEGSQTTLDPCAPPYYPDGVGEDLDVVHCGNDIFNSENQKNL